MKRYSLHIGVNSLSQDYYVGRLDTLRSCHNDAIEMHKIASNTGFRAKILFGPNATLKAVFDEIAIATEELSPNDIFLITFSGHGGLIPNIIAPEEETGFDQVWCLFDRMLVDNELRAFWKDFRRNVKVFVISDSCHSGSVIKFRDDTIEEDEISFKKQFDAKPTYLQHRIEYDRLSLSIRPYDLERLQVGVLLLSACTDRESTVDGSEFSRFTKNVLSVWREKGLRIPFSDLHSEVSLRLRGFQHPNLFPINNTIETTSLFNLSPFS